MDYHEESVSIFLSDQINNNFCGLLGEICDQNYPTEHSFSVSPFGFYR